MPSGALMQDMPGGENGLRKIVLPAALALALVLAGPAGAGAATIEAREEPSTTGINQVAIEFQAGLAESNDVTVSAAAVDAGARIDFQIVEAHVPLEAKGGCSGGGLPGAPVHCVVHAPKWADAQPCGKGCALSVPGTDWRIRLFVDLGDGTNELNAEAIPSVPGPSIDVVAKSGPGGDEITTGAGNDRFDPGGGNDLIHAGDGWDSVLAAAGDGDDVYDLGPNLGGAVDYSGRNAPLLFENGHGGAVGEQDQITPGLIVGGGGDDTFVGGDATDAFEGGGGNDSIAGGGDRDWIYGQAGDDRLDGGGGNDELVGGAGDDVYEAGAGEDTMMELATAPAFGPEVDTDPAEEPGGSDLARGGDGADWIRLGAEADSAFGEEGDDRIVGGDGTDEVDGGAGNDTLAGGRDFDRIEGGTGADEIFAGTQLPTESPGLGFAIADVPGPGPDSVDCGGDPDRAYIDPTDRLTSCEQVQLDSAIVLGKPIRDRKRGTALLPVRVPSPGRVILSARGIGRVVRPARANRLSQPMALLPVRPRGKVRLALARTGRRKLQLKIRYVRRDGGVFTDGRRLTLFRARS